MKSAQLACCESDSRCGCCRNQLAPAFKPSSRLIASSFFPQHCPVGAFLFIFLSLSLVDWFDLWSRMFLTKGKFDTIANFHQSMRRTNKSLLVSLARYSFVTCLRRNVFLHYFYSKWNWYIDLKSGRQIEKHKKEKKTCKSIDWPLILD